MPTDLTTHSLPRRTPTDRTPRWEVRYKGQRIGTVEEKTIGRGTSKFFHAFVLIDGQSINLQLDVDFEKQCDTVLKAWLDPASSVHVRDELRLPERP